MAKAKTIAVRSWNDVLDALYAGSWSPELQRFRSPFVFRGMSCEDRTLSNSLVRLAGDADTRLLENALLRNFRKYAHDEAAFTDSICHWLARHPALCRRVVIPKKLKWEIRDKLDQANVNERVLFPGLDGLTRWLTRCYLPASSAARLAAPPPSISRTRRGASKL